MSRLSRSKERKGVASSVSLHAKRRDLGVWGFLVGQVYGCRGELRTSDLEDDESLTGRTRLEIYSDSGLRDTLGTHSCVSTPSVFTGRTQSVSSLAEFLGTGSQTPTEVESPVDTDLVHV